jgi:hypothetical protein
VPVVSYGTGLLFLAKEWLLSTLVLLQSASFEWPSLLGFSDGIPPSYCMDMGPECCAEPLRLKEGQFCLLGVLALALVNRLSCGLAIVNEVACDAT